MTLVLNGTNGLSDVDGSAATPAIRGTDANTGIFFPAADTIAFSEGGTEAMRIDSSGNVGIGTSSSVGKLTVSKSGAEGIEFVPGGTSNVSTTQYYNRSGAAYTANAQDASYHSWLISGAEKARIDSSGNLLVGRTTNTAGTKLNVFGVNTINAETSTATGACYQGTYSNTTGIVYFCNWAYNGAGVGNINSTGTTTSYVTTSDYRLKEDVQPMTGALAKVAQLNPVTYNWKSNGSAGQGFIAHELQEIVPECVSGEKDAIDAEGNPQYQGIDTSFLVATLTAALQELKALVDTQASTITTLTDRITALEAKP
jgi:hypothetical protein